MGQRRFLPRSLRFLPIFVLCNTASFHALATNPNAIAASDLVLWLDANDTTTLFQDSAGNNPITADDQTVSRWEDKSSSNNHALVHVNPATFNSDAANQINGNNTLKFDAVDESTGSVFQTPLDITADVTEDVTIFTVYRPRTTVQNGQGQAIWGNDNLNWDRFYYNLFAQENTLGTDGVDDGLISLGGSSQGKVVDRATVIDEVYLMTAQYDGAPYAGANSSAIFFNGALQVNFEDKSNNDAFDNFFIGWDGNNSPYDGDLAEIIVYDRTLTDCEMFRVNNYLSDKYGENFLNAEANYDFSASHPEDVAAISVYVDDPTCTYAALNEITSGALTVNDPSSNDRYETFLRFGHNADGFGSSNNVPDNNYIRLQQSWAVDQDIDVAETTIDVGTVDLTFDTSSFGIAPGATSSDFALLVDTDGDGDFSDASIVSNPGNGLTYNASADQVVIQDWDPVDGAFITLATLQVSVPEINIDDPAGVQEGNTITFTVSTTGGALVNDPVTLSYSFVNVSTNSADFSSGNANGTVTIADNQSSATIQVVTADDADATEAAETFTLTLDRVTLGLATISTANNVGTGTINDNDPSSLSSVAIQDGGDGIINSTERAGGVSVIVGLPADAVAGDMVELDLNNDDSAEVQLTLTAAHITAGNSTLLIPEAQVPTTGSLTVDARIVDGASSNAGPQVRDTATVNTATPDAPTSLEIQDGGDGRINAVERQGGVAVAVGLPANAQVGDTVELDLNGDNSADVTATITAGDDAASLITVTIPESQVPASGTLTVGASIVDAIGNEGAEAQDTATVDIQSPAVQSINRSNPAQQLTNANEVVFAVSFSESVTNVSALDFALSGAGATGASITSVMGSGNAYTVTVDVADQGAGEVDLNLVSAAGVQDLAGNDLASVASQGSDQTYILENSRPSVLIQSLPNLVTMAFTAEFEFSENVIGFALGDISLTSATASNFVVVDGNTYRATITPNGGNVSIGVAANVAQDSAGNGNTAAVQATLTSDLDGDGTHDENEPVGGINNPCLPSNTVAQCDSDNDGVSDGDEIADGSNPNSGDSDGDGIPDDVELGTDSDGDGLIDRNDPDSDNDGILDADEVGDMPLVPRDSDNDGLIDILDKDSDNDGIPDAVEGNVDTDGDGLTNHIDADSDNDGIPDTVEDNLAVGSDMDMDGIDDGYDVDELGGNDANNDGVDDSVNTNAAVIDSDGDNKPDYIDSDSDNDGIPDALEANLDVLMDIDGDQINDEYDVDSTGGTDANGDGVDDDVSPPDSDGDSVPDYRDIDSDNDTLLDVIEAGGEDEDRNGVIDDLENNEGSLSTPTDSDADGNGDWREVDSDNDGNFDIETSPFASEDANNDGVVDNENDADGDGLVGLADRFDGFGNTPDSDGDGILDNVEGNDDTDGDGLPDFNDPDSDNDGINDEDEVGSDPANPADFDNDGTPNFKDDDSDNDGISDALEGDADLNNNGKPDYLDADGELQTAVKGSGAGSIEWFVLMALAGLAVARRYEHKAKRLTAASLSLLMAPLALMTPSGQAHAEPKTHCAADQYRQLDDKDWSCWYGGVGLGYSYLSPDGEARNFFQDKDENHDIGLHFYVGRMLSEHWFAEFKYADLGEAGLTNRNPAIANAFPNAAITYDVPSLMAGYEWKIEKAWRPYAKAGLAFIKNDATGGPVPYDRKTSTQFAFALGVKYQQENSPWFVRLDTDFYDRDAWYAGVSIGRYLTFSKAKEPVAEPAPEPVIAEKAPEPVVEPVVEEPVVEEPAVEELIVAEPVVLDSDKDGVPDELDKCANTPLGMVIKANGCPKPLEIIYFASASAKLSDAEKLKLNDAVEVLNAMGDVKVEVQAHTDSVGNAAYNLKLSKRRAASVSAYLVEQGVEQTRLTQRGFGESALVEEDDEDGSENNRRVVLKILK